MIFHDISIFRRYCNKVSISMVFNYDFNEKKSMLMRDSKISLILQDKFMVNYGSLKWLIPRFRITISRTDFMFLILWRLWHIFDCELFSEFCVQLIVFLLIVNLISLNILLFGMFLVQNLVCLSALLLYCSLFYFSVCN